MSCGVTGSYVIMCDNCLYNIIIMLYHVNDKACIYMI